MSTLQTVAIATNNRKDNHFFAIFHLFASLSRVSLDKLYKLSYDFAEGNTWKVSTCFLCFHFCDEFRDDHAMRIRGPLAGVFEIGRRVCWHFSAFYRAWLSRRFLKARAVARFRNQFARGQNYDINFPPNEIWYATFATAPSIDLTSAGAWGRQWKWCNHIYVFQIPK